MGKTTVSFLIFLVQMSVSLTYCLFFPETITGYFGVSVLWCWNHHLRYRCKHCLLCQSFLWCSHGCLATASLSCVCANIHFLPRGLVRSWLRSLLWGQGRVGWGHYYPWFWKEILRLPVIAHSTNTLKKGNLLEKVTSSWSFLTVLRIPSKLCWAPGFSLI